MAPFLKIAICPVRQKDRPRFLELGPGLVEGGGRAVGLLARMAARIEAARPTPRIFFKGNTQRLAIVAAWISP